MKLLTETEVVERLRCSQSKVKRLRLSGRLPYIPGRPLLIDEADLEGFIAAEKERMAKKHAKPLSIHERHAAMTPAERQEDARKWAQMTVLLKRVGTRKRGQSKG